MTQRHEHGKPELLTLDAHIDQRGSLIVGEFPAQLPFEVNRFFVVSAVPEGEPRGIHAHKECHQLLVCVAGSVKAMVDDGVDRTVHTLAEQSEALYMPPLTWGCQYDFSEGAVLLVLASHAYDAEDYIHEYDEFLGYLG